MLVVEFAVVFAIALVLAVVHVIVLVLVVPVDLECSSSPPERRRSWCGRRSAQHTPSHDAHSLRRDDKAALHPPQPSLHGTTGNPRAICSTDRIATPK